MRWWGATMDALACYECGVPGTDFKSFLKKRRRMLCNANLVVKVLCLHTGACLWRHGVKDLKLSIVTCQHVSQAF